MRKLRKKKDIFEHAFIYSFLSIDVFIDLFNFLLQILNSRGLCKKVKNRNAIMLPCTVKLKVYQVDVKPSIRIIHSGSSSEQVYTALTEALFHFAAGRQPKSTFN